MSLPQLSELDAIVVDIEGTTTPISFVYDVLFPFAREHTRAWLQKNLATPVGEEILSDFRSDADVAAKVPEDASDAVEPLTRHVHALMDTDSKTAPLKKLQGKIWVSGYESGELQGVVWSDVVGAFERWKAAEKTIWIYSSGSVAAQKLLFGNSDHGDLLHFISGHFDVTTGGKKDSASYRTIAEAIGSSPDRLLFATDNLDEAVAANEADWHVVVMRRPGNPDIDAHDFVEAQTFDELP